MSVDGTELLFEGFLEKRKDTMKIRWTTYWFRLHNTTLFFYTKKNGSASHLRGYYYIYTVQSVREVQRAASRRYMFEIIMTDGKKKMLAAETAGLRREWVGHLWHAMQLSNSGSSSTQPDRIVAGTACSLEPCDLRDRNSSASICSESEIEMLPARPFSAPAPSDCTQQESWSIASTISISEELSHEEKPTYQNTLQHYNQQTDLGDGLDNPQGSIELSNTECRQEGDYDILPSRNQMCEINTSAATGEGVYDYPLSYRMVNEHQDSEPTEDIYDVPSSLLRRCDGDNAAAEAQDPEGIYWMI